MNFQNSTCEEYIKMQMLKSLNLTDSITNNIFEKKDKICLKNDTNKFLISIQREDNGEFKINCEEIYNKKEFFFAACEKEIGELTKSHSLQMSSLEFYNMFIDNVKNNTYQLEYNDQESKLKITIQFTFKFNLQESIRKFEIKFICCPFDNDERINKIVSELQYRMYPYIDEVLPACVSEIAALKAEVVTLDDGVAALKAEVSPLKTEVVSLNNEFTVFNSEVAILRTEIIALNAEVAALKIKIPLTETI